MKPRERFKVQTVAEFMNSGPPLGSREQKNAIEAEEREKRSREHQRREHLARMTPEDIARERGEFEQCEYISQMKRCLTDKQAEMNNRERLPEWLQ